MNLFLRRSVKAGETVLFFIRKDPMAILPSILQNQSDIAGMKLGKWRTPQYKDTQCNFMVIQKSQSTSRRKARRFQGPFCNAIIAREFL